MARHNVSDRTPTTTWLLRDTIHQLEELERAKREHAWEVRRTAAEFYFGRDKVYWGGRWAHIFQEQFSKLLAQGRDHTAIPRYDELAQEVASIFPEYQAEDGTARLWDFLLGPHDPMPPRDEIVRAAICQVAQEIGG